MGDMTMMDKTRNPDHMKGAGGCGTLVLVALLAIAAPGIATGAAPARAAPGARAAIAAAPAKIERVRYLAAGNAARVIVLLSRAVPYEVRILPGESARGSERRLVIDFSNASLGAGAAQPIGVEDGLLKRIRTGQFTARTARVVIDLASVTGHSVRQLDNPARVVVDIAGRPAQVEREEGRQAAGKPPAGAPPADVPERAPVPETGPPGGAVANESRQAPAARERVQGEEVASARPQGEHAGEGRAQSGQPRRAGGEGGPAEVSAGATTETENRAAPVARGSAETSSGPLRELPPGPDVTPPAAAGQTPRSTDPSRPSTAAPVRGAPWRIVLDPGHGGNDPGTQGVDGVFEKDVTLAIAKRLQHRLEESLGAQVLLTRDGDVSRSLAQRTAFANAAGGDIFVSIHANADAAGELHGIETYTLNNSNERATIRLAKMENGPGVHTARGDLSLILSDMVQNGKEEDSIALAERLHYGVLGRLRTRYPDVRNLGVKKGPFYVLVGAYMPCVLVETSFLSHPVEGRRLASAAYQDEIAEGLHVGIAGFLADARLARTL